MPFGGYLIKFTSDNYIPPKIKAFSPCNQDLDSDKTKRNLQGKLFRDRVAVIPEMDLEVAQMTASEMGELLRHLSPVKFQVQYWDAETETYKTNYFYCPSSGRKPKVYSIDPALIYEPMSFRLVGYQNV